MKKFLFSITPADCELQTFTVHGPGGGGKDTSNTGVRYIHKPSGAVGEAREERSQPANKRAAWKRLATHPKMQQWIRMEAAKRAGQPSVDELVDRAMEPHNLKVEVRRENHWHRWESAAGLDSGLDGDSGSVQPGLRGRRSHR